MFMRVVFCCEFPLGSAAPGMVFIGRSASGGHENPVLAHAFGIALGHMDGIALHVGFGVEHGRRCGAGQGDEALNLLRFPALRM